jgi:hypothetical protein
MSSLDAVNDRLSFARRRLKDLEELTRDGEDLGGADPKERQQLIQEFFFHLLGATEFLAQVVNTSKSLGIDTEKVTINRVCVELNKKDQNNPIKTILENLHPPTSKQPLPSDPYSEEGCHHGNNPFCFTVSCGSPSEDPSTSLLLDPRDKTHDASKESAISELNRFYELVEAKCQQVLAML